MLKKNLFAVALSTLALAFAANAQGVKPSVITGEVASVSDTKIVVNAAAGPVDAVIAGTTVFKRVAPDNPSPSAATASSITDLGVGDKVMVTGVMSADGKTLPARAVYLMTKSDLSQKKAKDTEAWRTRGIAGKVSAVNAQTGQITVDIRNLMGSTTVTVTPKANAKFIRYAPDSERFDEAKPSSITEIKAGDMLRALGEKSADGTALSADTVLTGAFQTVAGTVVSVDAEKNEIVVNNLQTKKPLTISLATATTLKRFPAEMAERMAGMQGGGAPGGGVQMVRPVGGGAPPAASAGVQPVGGGNGPRPMGGRGGGGIDEMLDRFPTIKAADLKVGDMIAVSSTRTDAAADHIRAIKLLAGVEPFIKMAQMTQAAGGARPGRGVDFNIPGLDGVGP
jgi:ribosomal protein L24